MAENKYSWVFSNRSLGMTGSEQWQTVLSMSGGRKTKSSAASLRAPTRGTKRPARASRAQVSYDDTVPF